MYSVHTDTGRLWVQFPVGSYQRLWICSPCVCHSVFRVGNGGVRYPGIPECGAAAASRSLTGGGVTRKGQILHPPRDASHWDLNLNIQKFLHDACDKKKRGENSVDYPEISTFNPLFSGWGKVLSCRSTFVSRILADPPPTSSWGPLHSLTTKTIISKTPRK